MKDPLGEAKSVLRLHRAERLQHHKVERALPCFS